MDQLSELFSGFILGNQSILTNVCILPLYPGLIAYLASSISEKNQRATKWLGLFVLAGILSLMIALGAIFYTLSTPISKYLPYILPVIYFIVLALGIGLLFGANPFKKMGTPQSPLLKNPYIGAFVYGVFLAPMTLPCTGPFIVSAFLVGAGSGASLANSLLYFVAFGIGFGWPLVLLPALSTPIQRQLTRWLAKNSAWMNRLSGLLLIGIALYGLFTEWLPNL